MSDNIKTLSIEGRPIKDMSAGELAAITFRKRCKFCGGPPSIRIRVLVQLDELTRREPEFVAMIAATNPDGPIIPTIATTYGAMVRLRDYCACSACQVDAEVAAAHYPSWQIVEINRAPSEQAAWEKVSSLV
jgi:hypothetical protein